ncbi:MAG TPA: peptidase C15 [Trichocoleus sp.]
MAPLLITSFAPWKAHQTSNSSDDLLARLYRQRALPPNAVWMRQIPVNYQLAPCQVIAKLVELRPAVLVCCGMAEKRQQLSLELNGRLEDQLLKTTLNLPDLLVGTRFTEISPCAGTYVCNHLYFRVLEFIQRSRSSTQALFIHVPCLTPLNEAFVVADFVLVLERLSRMGQEMQQAA